MNSKILRAGAAVAGALLLVTATFSTNGVYAQDGGSATPGAMSGPMSMTGACTTGLAASMLAQAQMMMSPTMGATADGAATTEATADMAGTPMATMDMGATTEATADGAATTEATADMAGTPMAAMTETMCYVVYLSGATEVPDMGDPDGYGVAAITVDPTANTITFDVAVAGITLPATMTHIHEGAAGVSGGVVVPANGAPDANGMQMSTSDPVDAALIQAILTNPAGYYFNVHTEDFPAGALRGQLTIAGMGAGMGGDMSGTPMATMDPAMATVDPAMAPSATP